MTYQKSYYERNKEDLKKKAKQRRLQKNSEQLSGINTGEDCALNFVQDLKLERGEQLSGINTGASRGKPDSRFSGSANLSSSYDASTSTLPRSVGDRHDDLGFVYSPGSKKASANLPIQGEDCALNFVQEIQEFNSKVQGVQFESSINSSFKFEFQALILLGCLTTSLLLYQMLEFYSEDPPLLRLLKSVTTEGLVLFFSTLNSSTFFCRVLYRVIAFLMCALSLYTMSAKQLDVYALNVQKHEAAFKSVQEIQTLIQDKQLLQVQFVQGSWLSAAKKNSETLELLNRRLESSRLEWLETVSGQHHFVVQILTRLFFMVGNVFIARRLLAKIESRKSV